jgi:hypothetical protein
MSIMRKADFTEDYETALAAAEQATATAQLIGVITQRLATVEAAQTAPDLAKTNVPSAIYFIALKDRSVEAATRYWIDGPMLHYITPGGAHIEVRLELVDRDLSTKLNSLNHHELSLPQ